MRRRAAILMKYAIFMNEVLNSRHVPRPIGKSAAFRGAKTWFRLTFLIYESGLRHRNRFKVSDKNKIAVSVHSAAPCSLQIPRSCWWVVLSLFVLFIIDWFPVWSIRIPVIFHVTCALCTHRKKTTALCKKTLVLDRIIYTHKCLLLILYLTNSKLKKWVGDWVWINGSSQFKENTSWIQQPRAPPSR